MQEVLMRSQFKILCYCTIATVLAGCAPSASTGPDTKAGSGSAAAGTATGSGPGEGDRGGAREADTGASSLKQLQEGKSPITPGSSPLKDVYFDFDQYDLSADARTVLRANADWLKTNSGARVEIEGHCDERGTNEYNLALGAKRAQSAREYLTSLGVAPGRLSTISYGEEIPVCKEQAESCWRQNRRARFVILQDRPTS
jgi:peptidoglycan-associated lipoprotein